MFYFLLLVLSTLLSLTNSAYAATYWVAKTGSDGNSCAQAQSQSTPKLTVNSGITCLSAGDTLTVRAGNYNEAIGSPNPQIPGGSSWSSPVTIRAASGERVVIRVLALDNPYVIIDGINVDKQYSRGDGSGDSIAIWASHVRLQNLEVTGAAEHGIGAVNGLDDLQFLNLNVHHNGIKPDGTVTCSEWASSGMRGFCHGTYFNYSTNVVFRGGQYHDNEGYGIHNGNPGQIVDSVAIYNNYSVGIIFRYGQGNNLVINSLLYNNGNQAVWCGGTGNQIYNNTFFGNQMGILFTGCGATVRNNLFWNTGDAMPDPGSNTLSNNLIGIDPLFVNAGAGDFRLQSGSSAINAGQAVSEVTTDFDGNSRPQGPGYDIGAYEYRVNTLPPPSNLRIVSR